LTENRRLPRGPNATRPGPEETIRKRTSADLQNGWLGRHGNLLLTDDRLVFLPTILDTAFGAKRRQITLDELREVERQPLSPDGMIPGGKRPRMILHTDEAGYEFMVGDIDAWIDALQVVYERRARRGQGYRPLFRREGSTTALFDDDFEPDDSEGSLR